MKHPAPGARKTSGLRELHVFHRIRENDHVLQFIVAGDELVADEATGLGDHPGNVDDDVRESIEFNSCDLQSQGTLLRQHIASAVLPRPAKSRPCTPSSTADCPTAHAAPAPLFFSIVRCRFRGYTVLTIECCNIFVSNPIISSVSEFSILQI